MKQYELLYIIPAKYTEAEIDAMTEKVSAIVTAAGAKVIETHQLGKRKLAYPIENTRNGNYVLSFFEAEAETLKKLDQNLRLSTEIIRHLIVDRDLNIKEIPNLVETDERGREREERRKPERKSAPKQASAKKSDMSSEELDKKLDKILTEEVL